MLWALASLKVTPASGEVSPKATPTAWSSSKGIVALPGSKLRTHTTANAVGRKMQRRSSKDCGDTRRQDEMRFEQQEALRIAQHEPETHAVGLRAESRIGERSFANDSEAERAQRLREE